MFRTLISICVLLISLSSVAQDSNWSVEVNFPYTFGDNFVDEGYNGALDIGLDYRFSKNDVMDLGASLNVGFFTRDDSRFNGSPEVNGSGFLFQPKVFASFHIAGIPELHPMVGLGYSIFAFNIDDQNFAGANFQENTSDDGVNLNLAVAYHVTEQWFLQLQYDYVRLSARNAIKTPYNQNVNIIKLGIGYRI